MTTATDARGLLRECRDAMQAEVDNCSEPWDDLKPIIAKIDAFLTAAPVGVPFAELDVLYEKATKGPWYSNGPGIWAGDEDESSMVIYDEGGHTKHDAALIVALVNAYPAIRAALAAARRDIEAYRGAIGYSAPGDHDGRLSDGTTPICGLCDAKEKLLAAARSEALEEAAKVAEQACYPNGISRDRCVNAIRALKNAGGG